MFDFIYPFRLPCETVCRVFSNDRNFSSRFGLLFSKIPTRSLSGRVLSETFHKGGPVYEIRFRRYPKYPAPCLFSFGRRSLPTLFSLFDNVFLCKAFIISCYSGPVSCFPVTWSAVVHFFCIRFFPVNGTDKSSFGAFTGPDVTNLKFFSDKIT